jgi:hypothetical protein
VLFTVAIIVMVSVILPTGTLSALVELVLASSGALVLYVTFAKALGVTELIDLASSFSRRLGR